MQTIIYSHSFIQFLSESECNIAKILYSIYQKETNTRGGKWYAYDWHSSIITNAECNYLTFRGNGTISFLPAGKPHLTDDNNSRIWKRDGRQEGKAGKVIRKIFNERFVKRFFKDSDFEKFSNEYKAKFNDDGYKFELLPNTEIKRIYDSKIAQGGSSLNGSCMNGDSAYLDIYANCKQLQILAMTDKDNNLCGRCLVWSVGDNITIADRFYVTQDFMYEKFIDYCKANKLWYKRDYTTYDGKQHFIDLAGNVVRKQMTITTPTSFSKFPYIDTFSYGNDGSLNNFGDGCYTYACTTGHRDGSNNDDDDNDDNDDNDDHEGEVYDDLADEYIDENDACYIEFGERQYRGRWTHRDNCQEVNGNYYHEDDDNICQLHNGDWAMRDDCTYVESENEYYDSEDCVYSESEEQDILMENAVEINNDWYSNDNDDICEIGGTWYLKSDSDIVEIDGDYYVKDDGEVVEISGTWYLIGDSDIVEIDGDYYHVDDDRLLERNGEYFLRQLSLPLYLNGTVTYKVQFEKAVTDINNVKANIEDIMIRANDKFDAVNCLRHWLNPKYKVGCGGSHIWISKPETNDRHIIIRLLEVA